VLLSAPAAAAFAPAAGSTNARPPAAAELPPPLRTRAATSARTFAPPSRVNPPLSAGLAVCATQSPLHNAY